MSSTTSILSASSASASSSTISDSRGFNDNNLTATRFIATVNSNTAGDAVKKIVKQKKDDLTLGYRGRAVEKTLTAAKWLVSFVSKRGEDSISETRAISVAANALANDPRFNSKTVTATVDPTAAAALARKERIEKDTKQQ
jgi:hypothetical protein